MVSPGPTPSASRTVLGKATWLLLESLLICIIYSFTLYSKTIATMKEMSTSLPKGKMFLRKALRMIAFIGVIVPRRLRAVVADLDPTLPISNIKTVEQMINEKTTPKRLITVMMAVFAVIAPLMAGAGLYAVMAYA